MEPPLSTVTVEIFDPAGSLASISSITILLFGQSILVVVVFENEITTGLVGIGSALHLTELREMCGGKETFGRGDSMVGGEPSQVDWY